MAVRQSVEILKKGATTWNEWRKLNLLGPVDLSGVNLKAANLSGVNLSGTNLSWAKFINANLRSANLRGADLNSANFSGARLMNAHLEEANLRGSNLSRTDMNGANLSGADLIGADLSGADLIGADLNRADLSWVDLSDANLTEANLTCANLSRANLTDAYLSEANLTEAKLRRANLHGAILVKATLARADLSESKLAGSNLGEANLSGANLSKANLTGANLCDTLLVEANLTKANLRLANFIYSDLNGAIFNEATMSGTILGGLDFRKVKGLEFVGHRGPSILGIDTVYLSEGEISEVFLRGSGVPENLITQMKSLVGAALDFYSCFISYSTSDQEFANRLHADLQSKGVRCWFAPHDIKGGRKVHEQIDEAIRVYDKLLLILSDASMTSEWVKTEIFHARQKEIKQGRRVLFPIALVNFANIEKWQSFDADTGKDSAREIREYYIPSFANWNSDHALYVKEFDRLMRDLQTESLRAS